MRGAAVSDHDRIVALRASLALLTGAVRAATRPDADRNDQKILAIRLVEAEQAYENTRPAFRTQEVA